MAVLQCACFVWLTDHISPFQCISWYCFPVHVCVFPAHTCDSACPGLKPTILPLPLLIHHSLYLKAPGNFTSLPNQPWSCVSLQISWGVLRMMWKQVLEQRTHLFHSAWHDLGLCKTRDCRHLYRSFERLLHVDFSVFSLHDVPRTLLPFKSLAQDTRLTFNQSYDSLSGWDLFHSYPVLSF